MKKKVKFKFLPYFISLIIVLTIISVIGIIYLKAEYLDILGLVTFSFLIFVGSWMLYTKKQLPLWLGYIILAIGILGLIIDGGIIIKTLINIFRK